MRFSTQVIAGEQAGQRLDKMIQVAIGGCGLRAARRMIAEGLALVNGRPRISGYRLRLGDTVSLREIQGEKPQEGQPGYVGQKNSFYFFYKPPGWHTMALVGKQDNSLENCLPELLPSHASNMRLLQRLDFGASGLVLGVADATSASLYRQWEQAGKCLKFYYAVLKGELRKRIKVENILAGNGRKKMKALPGGAPALRHTWFMPCWTGWNEDFGEVVTVARCVIHSGQRHQIRAHAACAGFPLAGDSLYGEQGKRGFCLEHYRLQAPGLEMEHICRESFLYRNFDMIPALAAMGKGHGNV